MFQFWYEHNIYPTAGRHLPSLSSAVTHTWITVPPTLKNKCKITAITIWRLCQSFHIHKSISYNGPIKDYLQKKNNNTLWNRPCLIFYCYQVQISPQFFKPPSQITRRTLHPHPLAIFYTVPHFGCKYFISQRSLDTNKSVFFYCCISRGIWKGAADIYWLKC